MKKIKIDFVAERVRTAEMQYGKMMENIDKGIINQEEIVSAMTIINLAHQLALQENRMELIK